MMDKKDILHTLKQARQSAKKRKFNQTVDLIINLKNLDMKKETDRVNTYLVLPHELGKKIKVAALVGQELSTKARATCDHTVLQENFKTIEKKEINKITGEVDFFIAQANIMPQIASAFGKILGPKGLMPNPKAGCVVAPTADLKPVIEKLQKTVHPQTKNEPVIRVPVGIESMKDEQLVDNAFSVINNIVSSLPQEKNNVKSIMIKLTMGKPAFLSMKAETEAKK